MVLPLPVRPRPRTSRPASESGRVADWIGNASRIPCRASTATRSAGTPSSSNEVMTGPVRTVATSGAASTGAAWRRGSELRLWPRP